MPTQPVRRGPDERTNYCPFCHLRMARQEPQVSKQGQTFHEGCALKYDQRQQSPHLPTNAPAAESGSREAVLNSSSEDDLAVKRATVQFHLAETSTIYEVSYENGLEEEKNTNQEGGAPEACGKSFGQEPD